MLSTTAEPSWIAYQFNYLLQVIFLLFLYAETIKTSGETRDKVCALRCFQLTCLWTTAHFSLSYEIRQKRASAFDSWYESSNT